MANRTNETSFPAVVCEKLDALQCSVDSLARHITGGDDPAKGLIVRVDRLEQSSAIVRKFFWIAVGAMVTPATIGGFIWYLVSQHAK